MVIKFRILSTGTWLNLTSIKNLSYQSLFKILQITNQVAYVTRDYQAVLPIYEDLQKNRSDRTNKRQTLYDLQVLYYLANTYFRIKTLSFRLVILIQCIQI
jgi:hypothetical protein